MDWLTREISTGFQKLLCLGLDRQPAAEVIEGTVMVWLEVLTSGYAWDELRDTERFRQAFTRYAGSARGVWPQPADIVALLPRAEEWKGLPPRTSDSAECAKHIADLADYFRVGGDATH